ncbi:MAG: hypothetical protein RLO18_27780, partial [Gimesia chilikensis]
SPDDSNYGVEDIPEGMELRRDTIANDGGRVLSNLLLDDVKKASDVDFPTDKTITATFEGFEGFTVTVDLIEDEDQNWVRFRGSAPEATAEPASAAGEDGNEDDESAPPNDWNAIIAELNTKSEGWVYQLPG